MQYVTVGSNLRLPEHWRLLEGMIAFAGLITFAWSTGVLFAMAQEQIETAAKAGGDAGFAGRNGARRQPDRGPVAAYSEVTCAL
jgi:hypothetical protein